MKDKKGIALNQAFGAVLTLVLVGVLVIIGIVLFVTMNTSFAGTSAVAVVNETGVNATEGHRLSGGFNCSSGDFAIAAVNNISDTINSGNWSLDSSTGIITNTTLEFQTATWQVSYGYTWGSEACVAGEDMVTQFATYPVLVGLVGTIIFLGLVIGVLVASFVFGRRTGV